MSLQALLHPKSVAIVGASQNPQKVGGMPVRLLTELGYRARSIRSTPRPARCRA